MAAAHRSPVAAIGRLLWRRHENSNDGKSAYKALLTGGGSGFRALLGDGRPQDGHYTRVKAHGFYWTASESDAALARFINFGQGSQTLYLQPDGESREHFPSIVSETDEARPTGAMVERLPYVAQNWVECLPYGVRITCERRRTDALLAAKKS